MRMNRGQELVIGGYTLDGYTFGGKSFDALIFGYCENDILPGGAMDSRRLPVSS
jgi:hypothetical protein